MISPAIPSPALYSYFQIQDVPTRWGSTMNMIDRLVKHRESVTAVLTNEGHKHKLSLLTSTEWDKLVVTSKLLKPLEAATKLLGGEEYTSVSTALPIIGHLLLKYRTSDDDPLYVTRFKTALTADLETRREVLLQSMHVKLSTALDPRFKQLKCIPKPEREPVWNFIKNTVKELYTEAEDGQEGSEAQRPRTVLYDYRETESEGEDDSPAPQIQHDEFTRYMQLPQPDDDIDPLTWWKDHAGTLPMLTTIMRQHMCSPATSVPCERLFSKAGHIIDKKRSSLKPSQAEKLLCLNGWK